MTGAPEFNCNIEEWDKPFSGLGKRIIKAHTFAHQLDNLKELGYPIVMVYRNDHECMEWWKLCGEFTITYPNYQHFENLDKMWAHIQEENKDIMNFIHANKDRVKSVRSNIELCKFLNIASPKGEHQNFHEYHAKGIQVYLYE